MRRVYVSSALAILLLCFNTSLNAAPQEPNQTSPAPVVSAATYPNSPDGLKQFIVDTLGALESGDNQKASALLSSLAIPSHSAWFVNMVGPMDAPRFEARYEKLLPGTLSEIRRRFEYAADGGRTEVQVRALAQSSASPSPTMAEAPTQSSPTYTVGGCKPKEKHPIYLGDFSYVDGGFRFTNELSQATNTAAPPHIPGKGDVQAPKIIHSVPPSYPEVAKALDTTGVVVLHAIIGTDGKLTEITLVSGNSLLVSSAFDAVRQWKYQPCLLNGVPVEVDTTIAVQFQLH
jgi:TonB family protein